MWRTKAAFILKAGGPWVWVVWSHSHGNKHAAIIGKALEIGAMHWDFGQADHDLASLVRF